MSRDAPKDRTDAISHTPADTDLRPIIQRLPDHIVDQIAAGEVVERPASVVKELVENALDAGATHITVEVEQGGKALIRVLDNGCGMTEAEARLALQRHATSKLRALNDLYALTTMGFRGEALPSIAAVSKMTLTTRVREQLAGTRFNIDGGRIQSVSEVGAPAGTQIEIRDLLHNVPARLKFLKGNPTEASHVTDVVNKLAMAHPRVHVRLKHGKRTAIDAPMHASRMERVRALLGSRMGRRIHRAQGTENGVQVDAYLSAPELAQTTTRGVQLYVGLRPVKDRGLLHAIHMGYGELVPKGRYPVVVLFIDTPGDEVDVNVHPQKLEVRFSDAQAVYAAVRHTIRRGVADAPWLEDEVDPGMAPVRMRAIAASRPPSGTPSDHPLPGKRSASQLAATHAAHTTQMLFDRMPNRDTGRRLGRPRPPVTEDRSTGEFRETAFPLADKAPPAGLPSSRTTHAERRSSSPWPYRRSVDAPADSADDRNSDIDADELPESSPTTGTDSPLRSDGAQSYARDNSNGSYACGTSSRAGQPTPSYEGTRPAASQAEAPTADERDLSDRHAARHRTLDDEPPTADNAAADFFSRLRYIGQLDRTYLLCETDGELVLVDQHAAHERVAFQRLRERYKERDIPVQRMLFPLQVELTPSQAAVTEDSRDDLSVLGFELAPEDAERYAVQAIPAGLRPGDAKPVLLELLDDLAEHGGSRALEERLDLALATIACHSVVRAGDTLSPTEVEALFHAMDSVDFKAHCPHGRPVLLRISIGEIARRFGRT